VTNTSLPEYAKPPVVEVACSLQFDPIVGFHTAHLGMLWQVFREHYPLVQQQPPLPVLQERFDASSVGVSFNLTQQFPVPRLWFLNETGTRLIQVQQDHFVVNWRKLETDEIYPRYPVVRQLFVEELSRFREFLKREGLPDITPRQTELSYVNQIDAKRADGGRRPLAEITSMWGRESREGALPLLEEGTIQASYLLGDARSPVGRLHISIEPQRFVKDGAPLYAITLVARSVPEQPDMVSALASLDRVHAAIVEGFTSITTTEMHTQWERTR
jgi:uncharacterized protein (TIGR04255 family)